MDNFEQSPKLTEAIVDLSSAISRCANNATYSEKVVGYITGEAFDIFKQDEWELSEIGSYVEEAVKGFQSLEGVENAANLAQSILHTAIKSFGIEAVEGLVPELNQEVFELELDKLAKPLKNSRLHPNAPDTLVRFGLARVGKNGGISFADYTKVRWDRSDKYIGDGEGSDDRALAVGIIWKATKDRRLDSKYPELVQKFTSTNSINTQDLIALGISLEEHSAAEAVQAAADDIFDSDFPKATPLQTRDKRAPLANAIGGASDAAARLRSAAGAAAMKIQDTAAGAFTSVSSTLATDTEDVSNAKASRARKLVDGFNAAVKSGEIRVGYRAEQTPPAAAVTEGLSSTGHGQRPLGSGAAWGVSAQFATKESAYQDQSALSPEVIIQSCASLSQQIEALSSALSSTSDGGDTNTLGQDFQALLESYITLKQQLDQQKVRDNATNTKQVEDAEETFVPLGNTPEFDTVTTAMEAFVGGLNAANYTILKSQIDEFFQQHRDNVSEKIRRSITELVDTGVFDAEVEKIFDEVIVEESKFYKRPRFRSWLESRGKFFSKAISHIEASDRKTEEALSRLFSLRNDRSGMPNPPYPMSVVDLRSLLRGSPSFYLPRVKNGKPSQLEMMQRLSNIGHIYACISGDKGEEFIKSSGRKIVSVKYAIQGLRLSVVSAIDSEKVFTLENFTNYFGNSDNYNQFVRSLGLLNVPLGKVSLHLMANPVEGDRVFYIRNEGKHSKGEEVGYSSRGAYFYNNAAYSPRGLIRKGVRVHHSERNFDRYSRTSILSAQDHPSIIDVGIEQQEVRFVDLNERQAEFIARYLPELGAHLQVGGQMWYGDSFWVDTSNGKRKDGTSMANSLIGQNVRLGIERNPQPIDIVSVPKGEIVGIKGMKAVVRDDKFGNIEWEYDGNQWTPLGRNQWNDYTDGFEVEIILPGFSSLEEEAELTVAEEEEAPVVEPAVVVGDTPAPVAPAADAAPAAVVEPVAGAAGGDGEAEEAPAVVEVARQLSGDRESIKMQLDELPEGAEIIVETKDGVNLKYEKVNGAWNGRKGTEFSDALADYFVEYNDKISVVHDPTIAAEAPATEEEAEPAADPAEAPAEAPPPAVEVARQLSGDRESITTQLDELPEGAEIIVRPDSIVEGSVIKEIGFVKQAGKWSNSGWSESSRSLAEKVNVFGEKISVVHEPTISTVFSADANYPVGSIANNVVPNINSYPPGTQLTILPPLGSNGIPTVAEVQLRNGEIVLIDKTLQGEPINLTNFVRAGYRFSIESDAQVPQVDEAPATEEVEGDTPAEVEGEAPATEEVEEAPAEAAGDAAAITLPSESYTNLLSAFTHDELISVLDSLPEGSLIHLKTFYYKKQADGLWHAANADGSIKLKTVISPRTTERLVTGDTTSVSIKPPGALNVEVNSVLGALIPPTLVESEGKQSLLWQGIHIPLNLLSTKYNERNYGLSRENNVELENLNLGSCIVSGNITSVTYLEGLRGLPKGFRITLDGNVKLPNGLAINGCEILIDQNTGALTFVNTDTSGPKASLWYVKPDESQEGEFSEAARYLVGGITFVGDNVKIHQGNPGETSWGNPDIVPLDALAEYTEQYHETKFAGSPFWRPRPDGSRYDIPADKQKVTFGEGITIACSQASDGQFLTYYPSNNAQIQIVGLSGGKPRQILVQEETITIDYDNNSPANYVSDGNSVALTRAEINRKTGVINLNSSTIKNK